mmetsp:Transcript_19478/g.31892  ORF Transcript_19478/g.31892 Transcript_19478/m.31892 type:complete len:231 (+) Transcript_19478:1410-2102(+)
MVVGKVATEGPDGEGVAVGGVGDHAVAIEHTRDALLLPIATHALLLHKILDASFYGLWVGILGNHQSQKRPRCVDMLRTCRVLDVLLFHARQVTLAPSAILPLFGDEELAGLGDGFAAQGLPTRHQRLHAEPDAVVETHRPASHPAPVLPLYGLDKLYTAIDCLPYYSFSMGGIAFLEGTKGGGAGGCTLYARVVHHDLTKHLGRVEQFEQVRPSALLIRSPAAIDALQR